MGGRLRQKDADSSSIARCVLCTILCQLRYEKGTIITKVNEDGLHELEKQHKAVVLLYYMEVGVEEMWSLQAFCSGVHANRELV